MPRHYEIFHMRGELAGYVVCARSETSADVWDVITNYPDNPRGLGDARDYIADVVARQRVIENDAG